MPEIFSLCLSFLVNLAVFSALWGLYRRSNRLAVIDLYWGGGFLVIGFVHSVFFAASLYHWIFMAFLSLWAVRLTFYLALRSLGHDDPAADDPRYEAMKQSGGKAFQLAALWKVFWLQAVIQFALALPIHALFLMPARENALLSLYLAGMLLFGLGLLIELVADWQLARFKATNPRRDQLLTEGLWAWSRHPNHFGEAVLWFGLTLMVVAVTAAWWTLLAPLALTVIMVKLSGVAMLDAHLAKTKDGFDAYAERTSAFFLWPPRRNRG